jgi:hypothetical protein
MISAIHFPLTEKKKRGTIVILVGWWDWVKEGLQQIHSQPGFQPTVWVNEQLLLDKLSSLKNIGFSMFCASENFSLPHSSL